MNLIRILIVCLALLFTACGEEPSVGKVESAFLSTYHLGIWPGAAGAIHNPVLVPEGIRYMYHYIPLPRAPHLPSAQSAFTEQYTVGFDGIPGHVNTLTFKIYRINATATYPAYYHGSADIMWDDGAGNIIPTYNYLVVTGWPQDSFTMEWSNGVITLTVKDRFGNPTWVNSYGWSFPYGSQPNQSYSAWSSYTVNSTSGCSHDLPGYDDDVSFNGSIINVIAKYGASSTSNVHNQPWQDLFSPGACSLVGFNYNNTTNYQWHTGP